MKKIYFLLFIGIFTSHFATAQGWELLFNPEINFAETKGIIPTADGNYLVHGNTFINVNNGFGAIYRKIDDQGQVIWERRFLGSQNHINNLSDNSYITLGSSIEEISSGETRARPRIIKLDQNGEIVWEVTSLFPEDDNNIYFYNSFPLDNGNFIFLGRKLSPYINLIGEISSDGDLLWINETPFLGSLKLRKENGHLIFGETLESGLVVIRHEADEQGVLLFSDTIPNQFGFIPNGWEKNQYIFAEEETYLVGKGFGSAPNQTNLVLVKMDEDFQVIAKDSILLAEGLNLKGIRVLDDKLAIMGVTYLTSPEDIVKGFFALADLDLNIEFTKTYKGIHRSLLVTNIVKSHQSGYILGGGLVDGEVDPSFVMRQMYVFKTDSLGNIYNNIISGTISVDSDENCEIDSGEIPANNWIVTAHKPGLTVPFGTVSDAFGSYQLPVDTGNYTVHLTPQSSNWEACNNDVEVNFTEFQQAETVDFSIGASTLCPAMVVSLSVPTVRACVPRPAFLTYCNAGTITAEDAYLEIQLDALLTPISATTPWDNLSTENMLTWNIGDLEPLECGTITFMVELDCEAPNGLSYCLDAHVFPDTICQPLPVLWSGAFLEVMGACIDEEVNFEIKNIGTATMLEQSSFIIVEDAVLREAGETDLLAPEMENTFQLPGNGTAYTLVVNQVPNAPGNSTPVAMVEGCGTNDNGEFSINFSNQFPMDDYQLHTDTECPIAVNSFDPNDKNAVPKGFQEDHYIEPGTPLEYTIRFQNTGTDTAYLVVIRDTLNEWLDLTTFQKGNSSHDYELGLTGQGHLSFTFYNIALPDSAANQAASNGFVDFKITPRIETPVETVITNRAGIYFDYNEPVMTNQTFHTIIGDHLELLVNTVDHPIRSDIQVAVVPNPFQSACIFQITNHAAAEYQLGIFDVTGKEIHSESLNGSHPEFKNPGLSAGIYFYRLSAADGFLSTGRLVIY